MVPKCGISSSSIFTGDGEGSGFAAAAAAGAAAAAAAAAGGAGGFDFGVDPNLDPELALALRVSMEEERARQEAASKRAADEAIAKDGHAGESSGAPDVIMSDAVPVEPAEKASDMLIVCHFKLQHLHFCNPHEDRKGDGWMVGCLCYSSWLLAYWGQDFTFSSLKS